MFKIRARVSVCPSVCGFVHVSTGALGGQRPQILWSWSDSGCEPLVAANQTRVLWKSGTCSGTLSLCCSAQRPHVYWQNRSTADVPIASVSCRLVGVFFLGDEAISNTDCFLRFWDLFFHFLALFLRPGFLAFC